MPPRTATPIRERIEKQHRVTESGCWEWTGRLRGGYGFIGVKEGDRWTSRAAHRVSYQLFVGPIPEGLVLDHLCRNRACINPAHLEPVTNHENLMRGEGWGSRTRTHCVQGHEFTPENTWMGLRDGVWPFRKCVTCRREDVRRRRRAAREQAAAVSS